MRILSVKRRRTEAKAAVLRAVQKIQDLTVFLSAVEQAETDVFQNIIQFFLRVDLFQIRLSQRAGSQIGTRRDVNAMLNAVSHFPVYPIGAERCGLHAVSDGKSVLYIVDKENLHTSGFAVRETIDPILHVGKDAGKAERAGHAGRRFRSDLRYRHHGKDQCEDQHQYTDFSLFLHIFPPLFTFSFLFYGQDAGSCGLYYKLCCSAS